MIDDPVKLARCVLEYVEEYDDGRGRMLWEDYSRNCYEAAPDLARAVLEQTKRIEELEAWKADVEETQRTILDERCPEDERHCTCVPTLRDRLLDYEVATRAAIVNLEDRSHAGLEHALEILRGVFPERRDKSNGES